MDENKKQSYRKLAQTAMKKLENHAFATSFFETKEEVLEYLKKEMKKGSSVAVGGSKTLMEVGVLDWLTDNPDYEYYDRYHTDDPEKVFRQSFCADYYLMSSNAVTMDGMLYNVDGKGNRVAALTFGPKKVYVIVGVNKLVETIHDAVVRNEMISAPANNIRLQKGNPCEELGMCAHCNKETTICNTFVTTRRSGIKDRIHVLLVNEELGY